MAEWSMATVLKTVVRKDRGFESLSLRPLASPVTHVGSGNSRAPCWAMKRSMARAFGSIGRSQGFPRMPRELDRPTLLPSNRGAGLETTSRKETDVGPNFFKEPQARLGVWQVDR